VSGSFRDELMGTIIGFHERPVGRNQMPSVSLQARSLRELSEWDADDYIRHLSREQLAPELTEQDQLAFRRIADTQLTAEQAEAIRTPTTTFPEVRTLLAVHWHPEFVPLDLIRERIERMFPRTERQLIIPTQHNELMTWDGLSGVEVDCYAREFRRKVQILLHFRADRVEGASQLRAMLAHTFKYRASQLFQYIETIIDPVREDHLYEAAAKTAASQELIRFVRVYATRLLALIRANESTMPPAMIKNKLVRNYFDALRDRFDDRLIDKAQEFLRRIKKVVKAHFDPTYFFLVQEMIEEARTHNGIVIVPHPEQFWPILMADYDVDGYEVWNPQSRDYTEFLIGVVNRANRSPSRKRRLLALMGDDCHMGEKVKPPIQRDAMKSGREIGLQPAWDELHIQKGLVLGNMEKKSILDAYEERLSLQQ